MSKALDLVNKVFGKVTVLSRAPNHITRSGKQISAFECRCECGREVVLTGDSLQRGRAVSCGHGCLLKAAKTAASAVARKEAISTKMKSARAAVLKLKRTVHQSQIDEDTLFGLCKPISECGKYFLYQNGRLFSMRSLKFLRLDHDHGEYQNTPNGITRVRRVPTYTIVLDRDINAEEDRGQLRISVASLLLKTFDRLPKAGEKAWPIDYLRSQKKNPKLEDVEWVNEQEHVRRSTQLSKLAVMSAQQRRYHIRRWDAENLQKMWADAEHFYL